jgi:hypothetical protein
MPPGSRNIDLVIAAKYEGAAAFRSALGDLNTLEKRAAQRASGTGGALDVWGGSSPTVGAVAAREAQKADLARMKARVAARRQFAAEELSIIEQQAARETAISARTAAAIGRINAGIGVGADGGGTGFNMRGLIGRGSILRHGAAVAGMHLSGELGLLASLAAMEGLSALATAAPIVAPIAAAVVAWQGYNEGVKQAKQHMKDLADLSRDVAHATAHSFSDSRYSGLDDKIQSLKELREKLDNPPAFEWDNWHPIKSYFEDRELQGHRGEADAKMIADQEKVDQAIDAAIAHRKELVEADRAVAQTVRSNRLAELRDDSLPGSDAAQEAAMYRRFRLEDSQAYRERMLHPPTNQQEKVEAEKAEADRLTNQTEEVFKFRRDRAGRQQEFEAKEAQSLAEARIRATTEGYARERELMLLHQASELADYQRHGRSTTELVKKNAYDRQAFEKEQADRQRSIGFSAAEAQIELIKNESTRRRVLLELTHRKEFENARGWDEKSRALLVVQQQDQTTRLDRELARRRPQEALSPAQLSYMPGAYSGQIAAGEEKKAAADTAKNTADAVKLLTQILNKVGAPPTVVSLN